MSHHSWINSAFMTRLLIFRLSRTVLIIHSTFFLFFFLIPCLLMFRIGSYFIGPEYSKKIFTSFTFVIFKQYLCIFHRIFEGIYMSCRLTSSFVVFNDNFGASILSDTLHSTSPSLKTRLCFYLFFIP